MTEQADPQPRDSADVQVIAQDGREILLVGTAHVSRESADLVRELIEKERPDRVCIELDAQRYEALTQRQRWEALDLREVTRKRQLAPLLANLVLAAYQKKLGGALGVQPGSELVAAARSGRSARHPGRAVRPRRARDLAARLGIALALEEVDAARHARRAR